VAWENEKRETVGGGWAATTGGRLAGKGKISTSQKSGSKGKGDRTGNSKKGGEVRFLPDRQNGSKGTAHSITEKKRQRRRT